MYVDISYERSFARRPSSHKVFHPSNQERR
jgi:hypothetical protein